MQLPTESTIAHSHQRAFSSIKDTEGNSLRCGIYCRIPQAWIVSEELLGPSQSARLSSKRFPLCRGEIP